ncbi:MAG: hypothetical protein F4X17_02590 [Gemmatimonadetes bacterium]|nr:hypothetical protein [Gemmatimonadota bacterium]
MRFIVLIVTAIGIATPVLGGSHDDEEETIIIRTTVRADSLLKQGQSEKALAEYVKVKEACFDYVRARVLANTHNGGANFVLPSLFRPQGDYRTAADHLQKSLATDPAQKPLFTILETVMSENIKLYDDIAFILDKVGLSAEAHEYRELVKDRRYFAETLTAALEPLREKSLKETMERLEKQLKSE